MGSQIPILTLSPRLIIIQHDGQAHAKLTMICQQKRPPFY